MAGKGGKQDVMLDPKTGRVASKNADDDSTIISKKVIGAHDPTLKDD